MTRSDEELREGVRSPNPSCRCLLLTPAVLFAVGLLLAAASPAQAQRSQGFPIASDHADPMDLARLKPDEPVITDLFLFPVNRNGQVVNPFARTDNIPLHNPDLDKRPGLSDEQRQQIHAMVVVLCIRPALTDDNSLNLSPYRYRIHMDTRTRPAYEAAPDTDASANHSGLSVQEARIRYGGLIERPEAIDDDVLIEITLEDDGTLDTFEVVRGLGQGGGVSRGVLDPDRISVWAGIRDDPFIFPAFFGTNVVAMVVQIPRSYFSQRQRDWLVWATSHRGTRQIDHVGRSLRTQNPRFEKLNRLPPSQHVRAIVREHDNPSLMRDIALRAGLSSYFAFRRWDFVPDVMIYSERFPAGLPNGRLLTDDVAAILAQHGDTLLLELSHHEGDWPRSSTNDRDFLAEFPYLAEPWPDPEAPEVHRLSWKNFFLVALLLFVGLFILCLAAVQAWQIIRRWLPGYPKRRRELL